MANYAKDSYVVGAPSTSIPINFPYQLKADVNLVIGGVPLNGAAAVWADPQTVTVPTMAPGTTVSRQRITEGGEMRAVMQPSNYDSVALNKAFIQLLYLAQELSDRINEFTGGAGFMPLDGSAAMTDELTLSGNPSAALSAVPKQYVDGLIAGIVIGSDLLKRDGSLPMLDELLLSGNPVNNLAAAPKQYVDTRVFRSGDTFTGNIGFGGLTNFWLGSNGGAPTLQVDANSYMFFSRANNRWDFYVQGSHQFRIGWDFIAFKKKGYFEALANIAQDVALTENGDIEVTPAGDFKFRGAGTTKTASVVGHTHAIGEVTNLGTELAGKAAVLQTFEKSLRIETVANKDYMAAIKMPHGFKINSVTTRCESGTCTLTTKINTTALGGTANAVSTAEQSQDHTTSNVGAAGDDIVFTASANSSCLGLVVTISYERTLA